MTMAAKEDAGAQEQDPMNNSRSRWVISGASNTKFDGNIGCWNRMRNRSRKKPGSDSLEANPSSSAFELEPIRAPESVETVQLPLPDHLVVLVNGIVGSEKDWRYAAKMFKERLGDKLVIHCSICNSATLTFHGVDVMGKRLADEIREVINKTDGLKKISFVSHSLGGLIARYAISQLYVPSEKDQESNGKAKKQPHDQATLLGLQPMNFITIATPHLGSRGHKQLPFLKGLRCLENIAVSIAHWFVGKTGRHLFLTDRDGTHPLLRRMVSDCEEGMFMSALKSFKRHIVYANVRYDHMVGWSTSSLRRPSELPTEINHTPLDPRYPHIIGVDNTLPIGECNGDIRLQSPIAEKNPKHALDPMEEEMISRLTQIPWTRIDVSFKGSKKACVAHSTIQVKSQSVHYEGADVILHMIDNFEV